MRKVVVVVLSAAALLSALLMPSPSEANEPSAPTDGMRFLPSVEEQFVAMTGEGADALGFHKTGTPDPSHCRHYQGLVRVDAADGTPYFLVTRSGNVPDGVPFCDTGDGGLGNLAVVRMGSRPTHGERMRSNRLEKRQHVSNTTPPAEDRAVKVFSFVDAGLAAGAVMPAKGYEHPGGMQLVGHTLAVAVESPRVYLHCPSTSYCVPLRDQIAPNPTLIQFFDVRDPESPVFTSQFAPVKADGTPLSKAGVVAFTPLPNGLYLMATTGGDGRTVYFYRSTVDDLARPDLSWDLVGTTTPEVDDDPQQTLQFLREGDINGDLYLAGVRGHPVYGSDHDKADLYRVDCQTRNECVPGEGIEQTIVRRGRVIQTFPRSGGGRLANGAAASTFHVTPSGELLLYVTEHDNDGPDGTVSAGEWASSHVVRDGNPTTWPSATVNGPHTVDEGSSVGLEGSTQRPATRAWFKSYDETDFGGLSVMVDYDDYHLDDFDAFILIGRRLHPPSGHANVARSWRWFAPVGCSIVAIDYRNDGPRTHVLAGTGQTVSVADLRTDAPDMFDALDAVRFGDDCAAYYDASIALEWDLDRDGTYETAGSPVTLSTAAVDGPSAISIPVRARHPAGGQTGGATAAVTVRNVAPQMAPPRRITDAAGNQVGVDVPFVLTNRPVNVVAGFTDPGTLDHQAATITWGDGTVDPHTAFSFDEAFGDGAGSVSHTHRFTDPGAYTITLEVRDDDNGVGAISALVNVRTPAQAVSDVIRAIDDQIVGRASPTVIPDLRHARRSLAGSTEHSRNGALAMIEAGNNEAAKAILSRAISWLRKAELGGADVATEIALLEQVAAAV